jgi:glycosyltransferase involved in cell wall biosynthesis
MPLVSILIPTYNQNLEYLQQSVNSAIAQTYPNFEIIISDNHSDNGTPQYFNSLKDKRIRLVKPPTHLPITPHFQWLSEQAQGRYISFLCSDDWLEPTCIAELVDIVHLHKNVVAGFCNVKLWSKGVLSDFVYLKKGIFLSKNELKEYIQFKKVKGNLVGNLLKKEAYQNIGGIGNGNLSFSADKWLLIQMAAQGDIAYTDSSLAVFRVDNPLRGQRIVTYIQEIHQLYALIERHYLDTIEDGKAILRAEKKAMALEYLGAIPTNLKHGDIDTAQFNEAIAHIQKLSDAPSVQFFSQYYHKPFFVRLSGVFFYFMRKKRDLALKTKQLFR